MGDEPGLVSGGLHLTFPGATSLDAFLDRVWEPGFSRRPAADLYAQASTWLASDISDNALFHGDLVRALGAIEAKVLLLPGKTDLYFPMADNANELPHLAHAELRPIPGIWGYRAGSPTENDDDLQFLRDAVAEWMR